MKTTHCKTILLSAGLLAMLSASTFAASDQDQLKQIMAGCQKSLDSIKSGKGSVLVTSTFMDKGKETQTKRRLDFVFKGKQFKISGKPITEGSHEYEGSYDGTKSVYWYKGDPKPEVRVEQGDEGIPNGDFMIFANPRTHGFAPLGTAKLDELKIVGNELVNGSECTIVQWSSNEQNENKLPIRFAVKYWVDINNGYTVPKTQYLWVIGGLIKNKMRESTVEMKKVGKDLWAPIKYVETTFSQSGKKEEGKIITFQPDLKLNVAVTDDELTLKIPAELKEPMTTPVGPEVGRD